MSHLLDSQPASASFDVVKHAWIPLGSAETIDGICRGEVLVIQRREGYRFAVDAVLLAAFAGAPKGAVVDLGTGCGIVSLVMASRGARAIVAVEIQKGLAELATRNVGLNRRLEQVQVVRADLRQLRGVLPSRAFDLVVANPPYVPLGAGHVNPGTERAVARHEISCSPADLGRAARYLLRDGGALKVIFPAARLVELMRACSGAGLEPRRLRMVHPVPSRPAKMVLLEAIKGHRGAFEVLAPLHLFTPAGGTSDELKQILGEAPDSGRAPDDFFAGFR